ncbi:cytochrome-c peroxidase [Magnetococcus sp. PR-3]|uniref:cytochrome-c peroxidase n=1 Tax=Magnetococcus sp. PR-3 TaxID=3120355 RepID=UPI002FCDE2B8
MLRYFVLVLWGGMVVLGSGLSFTPLVHAQEPLAPIPDLQNWDPAKAVLGDKIFHDPRLSVDDTVSCAHCHPLDQGGMDNEKHSVGVLGRTGQVNTPTIFNSSLNFVQFWDGRAKTLFDQISFPLTAAHEMASSWPEVIKKLQKDSDYTRSFSKLYPQGMTADTIGDALVHFERTLLTPNGRFDRWLKGEENILTEQEKEGYALFKAYGCSACHQGRAVGGNMYEKMGIMGNYFRDRGDISRADYGRFNHTQREDHRYEFKVPSLRNVALTAPYFHDGSVPRLEEAVEAMGRYQLGRVLPLEDIEKIVAFLTTLTGQRLE